jgi:hypothetical protein
MLTVPEQDIHEQLCGIFMDHDPSLLQDLVASVRLPDVQMYVKKLFKMPRRHFKQASWKACLFSVKSRRPSDVLRRRFNRICSSLLSE